jgi:hypothetical protein
MSTTGHPEGPASATSDVAAALGEAGFVRLVAAADGDALAALGVLADALEAAGTPFQVTVAALPAGADRATDADLTLSLGRPAAVADASLGIDGVASRAAYDVATAVGPPGFEPDPALALAGVVAAGAVPGEHVDTDRAGIARRPGVAGPTDDPAEAVAHSTLLYAPVSGDPEAAADLLADVDTASTDEGARRRVASLVALAVAGDEAATPRGTAAVERFLRPYTGGPFGTVGGYADVLDALARTRPGVGVGLALGAEDHAVALEAWRAHGRRTHRAVQAATTGRYDGLYAVRCDGAAPVGTVARLVRDFRSPEPVVLAVADGEAAALRTADAALDIGATMAAAADAVGGTGDGTRTRSRARFDAESSEFVVAFREAQ